MVEESVFDMVEESAFDMVEERVFDMVKESVFDMVIERISSEGNETSVQNLEHDNYIPLLVKPNRKKTNVAVIFVFLAA